MKKEPPRHQFLETVFTRQERLTLLFVIGVVLLGLGFLGWRENAPFSPTFVRVPEVHVNRAAPAELSALPGIGPTLAKRIVLDRQKHGRYLTLKDLSRVKGMTTKTLKKFEGFVRFD